jgi:hypothetical protein
MAAMVAGARRLLPAALSWSWRLRPMTDWRLAWTGGRSRRFAPVAARSRSRSRAS